MARPQRQRSKKPAEAKLLEEIYASPDDDAPRLVYADWLQERDDPRGEFIALQIERARGRARRGARRREDELHEEHGRRWRKPLNAWDPPHTIFERGFVAIAAVTRINNDPAWALVRECNVPPTKKGSPAKNLTKVTHCDHESFVAMSKLAEPLAIEDLGWIGPYGYDAQAAAARTAWERVRCLPKLRRLEMSSDHGSLAWLFRAPVAAQLEELQFAADADELARWRGELDGTTIPRFLIGDRPMNWRMGLRIGFERDRKGVLSRLIAIAPAAANLADMILRAIEDLPKGLLTAAHVQVETTVWKASESARKRVDTALRRAGVEPVFEKTQKPVGS